MSSKSGAVETPVLFHRLVVKGSHLFIDFSHREIILDMAARGGGHSGKQRAVAINALQKIRQRGYGFRRVRGRRGEPGFLRDLRSGTADVKAAHGPSGRHCFHADIAKSLVQGRVKQDVRLAEAFQHIRVFWQRAEKFNARGNAGSGRGFFQFTAKRAIVRLTTLAKARMAR